jgi:hypothetical protein
MKLIFATTLFLAGTVAFVGSAMYFMLESNSAMDIKRSSNAGLFGLMEIMPGIGVILIFLGTVLGFWTVFKPKPET